MMKSENGTGSQGDKETRGNKWPGEGKS